LILGQLAPDRGRVRVANHELPGAPLCDVATLGDDIDRVHQHWGVVFQRNALFSGSVYDNIALWLAEIHNMDRLDILSVSREVLESVGLPSDDGFLGQDHAALSGGMAKRLAVARALSMNPSVLFYDEPTTGLDPSSAAQIHELIASTHGRPGRAGEQRTSVIITHDKDLLQRLEPRVVMIHGGKVFFDGGFREFRESRHPVVRPYFDVMPLLHRRTGSS
jgi:phospholipid/cholesterol/gamma-HCH transport system ATP-binding protein